jgi:predicted acetyltransferase
MSEIITQIAIDPHEATTKDGAVSTSVAVTIEPAPPESSVVLKRFVQFYLYDLSWVDGWNVDDTGRFENHLLRGCWSDLRRHPFLIKADDRLAGFAIVDERDAAHAGDTTFDYDMAEFFILRRWRRHGVGRSAVGQLTRLFPGAWQIRPFPGYEPADRFWSVVCAELAVDGVTREVRSRPGKPAHVLRLQTSA